MGRKKKSPETKRQNEIKKVVKTLVSKVEPKKRGRKPGTKFGSYKKKNILPINEDKNDKTIITDNNNTNSSINSIPDNDSNIRTEILHAEEISKVTPTNADSNNDNTISPVNSIGNNSNSDADLLKDFIQKEGTQKELVYEPDNISTENSKPTYTNDNVSFGNQKQLISGTLLLAFCDFLFPTVIYKLMTYTNPEYKGIDKQKIKLTPDQKKDLEPAANEVAKYVFEKINPMTAFFIGLMMCYGSNFMDASEQLKTKLKENSIKENKPPIQEQVNRLNEIKKEVTKNAKLKR